MIFTSELVKDIFFYLFSIFYESALHAAISEEVSIELIDSIITTYPDDLQNRDNSGKLFKK